MKRLYELQRRDAMLNNDPETVDRIGQKISALLANCREVGPIEGTLVTYETVRDVLVCSSTLRETANKPLNHGVLRPVVMGFNEDAPGYLGPPSKED